MQLSLAPMRAALARRRFAAYLGATFLADTGFWIAAVAQGWLVLTLTHSTFWLGAVAAAVQVPALVVAFVGGAIADRFDRRSVIIATSLGVIALALATTVLVATHGIALWSLLVLALATGALVSAEHPADRAMIVDLTAAERMQESIALSSLEFSCARFAGPAIGGIAIAAIGIASGYALYAAAVVPIVALLLVFRARGVDEPPAKMPPPSAGSLRDAWRYLVRERTILAMCALVFAFTIGVSPYLALLPQIAKEGLGFDERGYGILAAVSGAGAVLGALGLALLGELATKGRIVAIAVIGAGIATAAFAMQHAPLAAGLALLVVGAADSVVYATANTYVQERTDPRYRARTNAFFTAAFLGGIPVGNLVAGSVATAIGPGATLVGTSAFAVLCAACYLVLARRAAVAPSRSVAAEA